MHNPDDMELLRDYAVNGSEDAFRTLVQRHIDIVYSAALRQVGNPALAQDVTQATFIILARKAQRLPQQTILAGWLYSTARFVALKALRAEYRRHKHEETFSQMNQKECDAAWDRIEPLLDEAMTSLREKERNAILLRYFQNKSLREVAVSLGIREQAAQKRIERAVDKLRCLLAKRGVASTAAILIGVLSTNAAQAAPPGVISLSAALSASAIPGTSLSEWINECFRSMGWQKAKLMASATIAAPIAIVMAVLLAGLAAGAPESARSGQPSAFEAAGFLEWRNFSNGVQGLTFRRSFQVAVKNGSHLIRINAAAGDQGHSHQEYGWDGTNGYLLNQSLSRGGAQNDSTLNITLRPEPPPISQVGPVWLAFCANHLFTNGSSVFLWPFTFPIDPAMFTDTEGLRFRTEGHLHKEPPHLLRSFTLFWEVEENDETGPLTLDPIYKSGKTNFTMNVLSWRQLNGLHIPQEFDFVQFTRPTNAQTVRLITRGVITNFVSGTSRTNFIPTLAKATRVHDERFASHNGPFTYLSTNGTIFNQPEDVAEQQRQQRAASAERARKRRAAMLQKERELKKEVKP